MADHNGTIVLTGEGITFARYAAIRNRLGLEIRTGLIWKGRALSTILADDQVFSNYLEFFNIKQARAKRDLYVQLNQFIVDSFGPQFDRPLA